MAQVFLVVLGVLATINLLRLAVASVAADVGDIRARARREPVPGRDAAPRVSVLISAHNHESTVTAAIRSALEGSYRNLEVIVVDDGSTDATSETVRAYQRENPQVPVLLLRQRHRGRAKALNNAGRYARGSIVLVLGADTTLAADAIGELVQTFADHPRAAVVLANTRVTWSWRPAALVQTLQHLVASRHRRANAVFSAEYRVAGTATAVRGSFLHTSGGFGDDTVTEDLDLTLKAVASRRFRVRYSPRAVVHVPAVAGLADLVRQGSALRVMRWQALRRYRALLARQNGPAHAAAPSPSRLAGVRPAFEPVAMAALLVLMVAFSVLALPYAVLIACLVVTHLVVWDGGVPRAEWGRLAVVALLAWPLLVVAHAVDVVAVAAALRVWRRRARWEPVVESAAAEPPVAEPDVAEPAPADAPRRARRQPAAVPAAH